MTIGRRQRPQSIEEQAPWLQAGGDCAWFGAFGKCEQLIRVATIMAVFVVLDVSCSCALSALRRVPPPYGSPIAHPRCAHCKDSRVRASAVHGITQHVSGLLKRICFWGGTIPQRI